MSPSQSKIYQELSCIKNCPLQRMTYELEAASKRKEKLGVEIRLRSVSREALTRRLRYPKKSSLVKPSALCIQGQFFEKGGGASREFKQRKRTSGHIRTACKKCDSYVKLGSQCSNEFFTCPVKNGQKLRKSHHRCIYRAPLYAAVWVHIRRHRRRSIINIVPLLL